MRFPDFFAQAPRVRVRDPLAAFLGAAEDGVLDYGYEDAVKLAGHSCPTVASAYLLTRRALTALYPDALPERGGVRVEFSDALKAGVAGVIASVVTLLTGAAQQGGFKGIGGRFVRRDLLAFEVEVPLAVRFTRLDSGAAVDAASDLSRVPADAEMGMLLSRCIQGTADAAERQRFGEMWQRRVACLLLEHADDDAVFPVVAVAA